MKQGIEKFTAETQGARANEGKKVGETFISEILKILGITELKQLLVNLKQEAKHYKKNTNVYKKLQEEIKALEQEIKFVPVNPKNKYHMTPDFIIKNKIAIGYLLLESKFKQIPGSDWEKLENNWGFHNYYYRNICGKETNTIVILVGFWRKLQKNLYPIFIEYVHNKYGMDALFDFGDSVNEIYRFAEFYQIELTDSQKTQIINLWNNYFLNK